VSLIDVLSAAPRAYTAVRAMPSLSEVVSETERE
jgi:hypothetical protein